MAGFELLASIASERWDTLNDDDGEETREGIPIGLWRSLR
jgi:hypothetical protein